MPNQRKLWKSLKSTVEVVFFVCAFLLALPFAPIIITVGALKDKKLLKKLIASAETTPCQKCGDRLGGESVEEAKREYDARRAATMQANPGHMIRFAPPPWQAICLNCRAGYKFDYETKTFSFVEMVETTSDAELDLLPED